MFRSRVPHPLAMDDFGFVRASPFVMGGRQAFLPKPAAYARLEAQQPILQRVESPRFQEDIPPQEVEGDDEVLENIIGGILSHLKFEV